LGTSLGVAATSAIANSVSTRYARLHPELAYDSPEALMMGYRAAGWTLFAAAVVSVIIGSVGLRGIGIVGEHTSDQLGDEQSSSSSTKDAGNEQDVKNSKIGG
jgi:hypothetical protein